MERFCAIHTVIVTSRLAVVVTVVVGSRGDLDNKTSTVVAVNKSHDALTTTPVDADDDGDRTIAPPFLGIDDPAGLDVQPLTAAAVVVVREAGDLADGDASLSVGERDEDVTAMAS